MSNKPFKPHWQRYRDAGEPDPVSWLYFVVSKIDSGYRPLSIAAHSGPRFFDSHYGLPIVSICHHLVTVFSSPSNRIGLQAEMVLARRFYADEDTKRSLERAPRDMPEDPNGTRGCSVNPFLHLTDQKRCWEFPYSSSCLKYALDSDPIYGSHFATLEPLNTVYDDNYNEHGMVIIDITNLNAIKYGIVAFEVARMQYVPDERGPEKPWPPGTLPDAGYRVVADKADRHRKGFSIQDFVVNFRRTADLTPRLQELMQDMEIYEIVGPSVLHWIWPAEDSGLSQSETESPKTESVAAHDPQLNLASDYAHLSLEDCKTPMTVLQGLLLEKQGYTSLSLCLDTIVGELNEVVTILIKLDMIKDLYFLVDPRRVDDSLSVEFYFKLLATISLKKRRVVLAGLHSPAISQSPWLSQSLTFASSLYLQQRHFDAFPIAQVWYCFKSPLTYGRLNRAGFGSHFVADGLLSPRQCIASVLDCFDMLSRFDTRRMLWFCFQKSSSLSQNHTSDITIGTGLAENHRIAHTLRNTNRTFAYGLQPHYWTLLLRHKDFPDPQNDLPERKLRRATSWRYAFVRPRHRSFQIDDDFPVNATVDDFEVVDLFGFAKLYDVQVDRDWLDTRLEEFNQAISERANGFPLPEDEVPFGSINAEEVLRELPNFMKRARTSNEEVKFILAAKRFILSQLVDW